MNNFTRWISAVFVMGLSLSQFSFAGDDQKFSGTWVNQWGSEVRLSVDSQGKVTGKYHTAVGRKEVTKTSAWFDVTGYVNGDVISFVVNWGPESGAITSWSGHFISEGKMGASSKQIRTLTHTSMKVSDENLWQRTVAGSDTFRQASVSEKN